MTIKKDLKWLNIRTFGLDWHTDRHMIRISKIFKENPGWDIASDWKVVDFWTMICMILIVGRIWASTDSYKSRDLEPGVILIKFLFFGDFQPRDSYKKNPYKKETVYPFDLCQNWIFSNKMHTSSLSLEISRFWYSQKFFWKQAIL